MLRFRAYINEKLDVPAKSSTLKIDRKDMPQIDGKHVKDFLSYLNKQNIDATSKKVDPEKLKATQHQFHKAKVQSLIDYIESGNYDNKRIIVSKDNYVMDGHHRWLAHKNAGRDIDVYQVNANAKDLIKLMHEYPKSYTEKLYEGTIQ